jgi:hypothetical protein
MKPCRGDVARHNFKPQKHAPEPGIAGGILFLSLGATLAMAEDTERWQFGALSLTSSFALQC